MSMIDKSFARNKLALLLDPKPSQSLPTTPVSMRRSPLLYDPSDEPDFLNPMLTLPATLDTLYDAVTSVDDGFAVVEIMSPPLPLLATAVPTSDGKGFFFDEPSNKLISGMQPASVELEKDIKRAVTCGKQTESEGMVVSTVLSKPEATSKLSNEANSTVNAMKCEAWEEIREILNNDSDSKWRDVVPLSYDVLPQQDQSWKVPSSDIERLRAFLDMAD